MAKVQITAQTLLNLGKEVSLNIVTEAGGAKLGRVWQHTMNHPFVVVSAFRGEYDLNMNMNRTADMINEFRKHNLGGIQLVGYYVETNEKTGKEQRVKERSFMVPLTKRNPDMTKEDLLNLALNIGKKYSQQQIIFGDEDGVFLYNCADGSKDVKIGDPGHFNLSDVKEFGSNLKGRDFKFDYKPEQTFESYIAPNSSISGMAMTTLGLYI